MPGEHPSILGRLFGFFRRESSDDEGGSGCSGHHFKTYTRTSEYRVRCEEGTTRYHNSYYAEGKKTAQCEHHGCGEEDVKWCRLKMRVENPRTAEMCVTSESFDSREAAMQCVAVNVLQRAPKNISRQVVNDG